MLTSSDLWKEFRFITDEIGVSIYDIEMPTNTGGILRLFIAQKNGECKGIDIDTCEMVSKKISLNSKFAWIAEQYMLEVSSPGINRKLRLKDHFLHAIGERVKMTVAGELGKKDETLTGTIEACDDKYLVLSVEKEDYKKTIALDDIRKASVDFLFR